jgi:hypothetical protein
MDFMKDWIGSVGKSLKNSRHSTDLINQICEFEHCHCKVSIQIKASIVEQFGCFCECRLITLMGKT